MKFFLVLIYLFVKLGCHAQSQQPQVQTAPSASPPPAASLKDLHWQLRDAIKMQLPATYPDERNGQHFKKSYSLDYQWSDELQTYLIELPEKRLDVESEQVTGGSKYFIPFKDVERSSVKLVFSEDEKLTGLLLPAKPGKTFLYHPYGNEPDEPVNSVVIGWYDRVQDRTLGRVLGLWQQFLVKMGEQEKVEIVKNR